MEVVAVSQASLVYLTLEKHALSLRFRSAHAICLVDPNSDEETNLRHKLDAKIAERLQPAVIDDDSSAPVICILGFEVYVKPTAYRVLAVSIVSAIGTVLGRQIASAVIKV